MLVATILVRPDPTPAALVPDAVGATPRAPAGPVAWRWSLPQHHPVQYLDVVGDSVVVLDLLQVPRDDGGRRPVLRLRLVDALAGTVRWGHRLESDRAVVVADGPRVVTTVVPAVLGNPVTVVALDAADGRVRWRTRVADLDGIAPRGDHVVAHGHAGCVRLDPLTGRHLGRSAEVHCLPWGPVLLESAPDGWRAGEPGAWAGPVIPADTPPVLLDEVAVAAREGRVMGIDDEGAVRWTRDELDVRQVRPFSPTMVRAEAPTTSTLLTGDGAEVATVPWHWRAILAGEGLTYLDVPPDVDPDLGIVLRLRDGDERILATRVAGARAGRHGPPSASAAATGRIGPSMFCPPATVTCRARRWPAVRMTGDGVLVQDGARLGLYDLARLDPRWEVSLDGAAVDAIASSQVAAAVLVRAPGASGRAFLRGLA